MCEHFASCSLWAQMKAKLLLINASCSSINQSLPQQREVRKQPVMCEGKLWGTASALLSVGLRNCPSRQTVWAPVFVSLPHVLHTRHLGNSHRTPQGIYAPAHLDCCENSPWKRLKDWQGQSIYPPAIFSFLWHRKRRKPPSATPLQLPTRVVWINRMRRRAPGQVSLPGCSSEWCSRGGSKVWDSSGWTCPLLSHCSCCKALNTLYNTCHFSAGLC